jgi:hypothetical protein
VVLSDGISGTVSQGMLHYCRHPMLSNFIDLFMYIGVGRSEQKFTLIFLNLICQFMLVINVYFHSTLLVPSN